MSSFSARLDQKIQDFLRDSQWRIAELSILMDDSDSKDTPDYKSMDHKRFQLYQFMDIIYYGRNKVYNNEYNFLPANIDWSEKEIEEEIEYLRAFTNMNNTPSLEFVGYYTKLRNEVAGGSTSSLPIGNPGDFIYYNGVGNPITTPFPSLAGMDDSDTINTYFDR